MAKYLEISETLKQEILDGKYEKEGKIPTEYELVSRFNVSRQTVRQAIACLKNEGYLYQVQGSGTYVSKPSRQIRKSGKTSATVMVICTYISDYIFPSIIRGIENKLSSNGITINLVATGNRIDTERRILQKILSEPDVDGIIVEGTKTGFPNPNIALYREIQKLEIPIIFLHCSYPELSNSITVGMKEMDGGRYSITSLVALGCRKFGAIFKSDDRQGLLRYAGFCDGLLDSGLDLDSATVRWYTTEDLDRDKEILSTHILDDFAEEDGVVCYNDQVTLNFINAFKAANRPLPKLFSFDHSHLCDIFPPEVISIGHRKEELGVVAATKMINMLEGKKEDSVFLDWVI